MKISVIIVSIVLCFFQGFGQDVDSIQKTILLKLPLDTSVLGKWPELFPKGKPSGDGKYFAYEIQNYPAKDSNTLIICALNSTWKKEFQYSSQVDTKPFFSSDNKQVIFKNADTVYILTLGTTIMFKITDVRMLEKSNNSQVNWFLYRLKSDTKQIRIHFLPSHNTVNIENVSSYYFGKNGYFLYLSRTLRDERKLQKLTLKNKIIQSEDIWSSVNNDISGFKFDNSGEQLAFFSTNKIDKQVSIWYYKNGMSNAIFKTDNTDCLKRFNLPLGRSLSFSENGNWIFFDLKKLIDTTAAIADMVKVNIWSYRDRRLNPEQLTRRVQKSYAAVIGVSEKVAIQIEEENTIIVSDSKMLSDYVVVMDNFDIDEKWWKISPLQNYYLVSLKDGRRKLLATGNGRLNHFSFSPGGKWLVYWDSNNNSYLSYEIYSGKTALLTKGVDDNFISEKSAVDSFPVDVNFIRWFKDERLLLYSETDIWEIDPSAVLQPTCLTNRWGKKNFTKLRFLNEEYIYEQLHDSQPVYLVAFNVVNKYNGFFELSKQGRKDPKLLSMGPFTYLLKESQSPDNYNFEVGMQPLTNEGKNIWIVKRSSATEFPNFYWTKNFRDFKLISNIHPQKKYNWFTTELINYTQIDGTKSQAVLYKPENFDSSKKYPVIFNYYEKLSHRVHQFPYPNYSADNIDIPWYVSHGYIVCTPDIFYTVASTSGQTVGMAAYNSVIGAINYISKLSYIDSARIGIQGHSFGGLQTSYLVTHSDMIAAAVEAAGTTDPISAYLTLIPQGHAERKGLEVASKQSGMERGHEFYGATPWEEPDLYKNNSAVLKADKAVAPLLIQHNLFDEQVNFRQGIELYMAFRRLGKRCWLLSYDDQGHGLYGNAAVDYHLRMTQFFDHYLKGLPPPKWMTESLLAKYKGYKNLYELDLNGSCGKDCKICKEKKYDAVKL